MQLTDLSSSHLISCKIEEISAREALPIVVGGTMYYVQHLVFPGRLVSANEESTAGKDLHREHRRTPSNFVESKMSGMPKEIIDLVQSLPELPPISTSSTFPPGFPTNRLHIDFRSVDTFCSALHQALQRIDPAMAAKLHWLDVRKVRRSIEIALQSGRTQSEILEEQRQAPVNARRVWRD